MSRQQHEVYRITDIKDDARDVKTFKFDRPLMASPGQFVMVWLPGVSENPFSASDPFSITVRKVGDESSFTSRLFGLNVDDRAWVRGPYGNGFPIFSGNIYVVGGGTGAIPLAFFSELLVAFENVRPTVLFGAKTKDEVIFEERFRKSSSRLLVSTEDGSCGHRGLVTDLFEHVDIEPDPQFYICGSEAMMKAVAERAMKYTNPKNIFLSLERYMKCGRGICGSCEVNGYRTCVDGPVFAYDKLLEGDFSDYSRTKSGTRIRSH